MHANDAMHANENVDCVVAWIAAATQCTLRWRKQSAFMRPPFCPGIHLTSQKVDPLPLDYHITDYFRQH